MIVIYSFNYTDCRRVFADDVKSKAKRVTYVHGCLEENNIILGFDGERDIKNKIYRYMRKSYNPLYKPTNLQRDLAWASDVVLFGHSLGDMDYHYFRDYFAKESHINYEDKQTPRNTWIFTKDSESRYNILDQLRGMNNKDIDGLMGNTGFHIVCTDSEGQNPLKEFSQYIKESVAKPHGVKRLN